MEPDRDAPSAIEFFQQVRALERQLWSARTAEGGSAERAEFAALGGWGDFADEPIHFRAANSVAHPKTAVGAIHPPSADGTHPAWLVEVNFMGLTGPMGVLPTHFTTMLLGKGEAARPALRDFLATFEHRIISRFYRAWELSHLLFGFERAVRQDRDDNADRFTLAVRSLTGLGDRSLCQRLKLSHRLPVYYAGLLSNLVRPAENLARVVTAAFGVPATLVEFVAEWQTIAQPQRTRMGGSGEAAVGADRWNNRLGSTACAGSRVWTVQDRFRLQIGPLDYATFGRFTPAGDLFPLVRDLVRLYAGAELAFDIQPVLKAAEVPRAQLRSHGDAKTRLGWNSWLISKPHDRPATDAIFAGSA